MMREVAQKCVLLRQNSSSKEDRKRDLERLYEGSSEWSRKRRHVLPAKTNYSEKSSQAATDSKLGLVKAEWELSIAHVTC